MSGRGSASPGSGARRGLRGRRGRAGAAGAGAAGSGAMAAFAARWALPTRRPSWRGPSSRALPTAPPSFRASGTCGADGRQWSGAGVDAGSPAVGGRAAPGSAEPALVRRPLQPRRATRCATRARPSPPPPASRITIGSTWSSPSTSGLSASTAAATRSRTRCSRRPIQGHAAERTVAAEARSSSTAAEGDEHAVCSPVRAPSTSSSTPSSSSTSWWAQNGTRPDGVSCPGGRARPPSGPAYGPRRPSPVAGSLRAVTGTETPVWARHLPPGVDPASVDLLARRSLPAAWAATLGRDPDAHRRCTTSTAGSPTPTSTRRSRRIAGPLRGGRAPRRRPGRDERGDVGRAGRRARRRAAPRARRRPGERRVHRARDQPHRRRLRAGRVRGRRRPHRGRSRAAVADGCIVTTPSRRPARRPTRPPSTLPLDDVATDDLALLCYTSGTTGAPKGAMLTHGNALASGEALRLAWRWTEHDRLVLALPLFHVHGLGVGLHGTLLAGASAVLLPRFDADAVLDAARDARRDAVLRRTHDVRAARGELARAPSSARLRLCVSGSAPLPPSLHEALARAGRGRRPRALRHDRDAHERVEPVRRRAPGGHGRRSRSPASRCASTSRRARSCCAARTCSPATGDATTPRATRSPTTGGSAAATSARTTPTATCASWDGPRS